MNWRDFEAAFGGKLRDILDYEEGEAMQRAAGSCIRSSNAVEVMCLTWGVERSGYLLVVAWLLRYSKASAVPVRRPDEVLNGDELSIGFVVVDAKKPGEWRLSDDAAFAEEHRYHEAASRAADAKKKEEG